jgi:hypothetical protein
MHPAGRGTQERAAWNASAWTSRIEAGEEVDANRHVQSLSPRVAFDDFIALCGERLGEGGRVCRRQENAPTSRMNP